MHLKRQVNFTLACLVFWLTDFEMMLSDFVLLKAMFETQKTDFVFMKAKIEN